MSLKVKQVITSRIDKPVRSFRLRPDDLPAGEIQSEDLDTWYVVLSQNTSHYCSTLSQHS